MKKTLEGKAALVTGGSRGIGAGIINRVAREGSNVALTYSKSTDKAQETVNAAQGFGVRAGRFT